MYRLLFSVILLLSALLGWGQTQIYILDFESPGGYTTSMPEQTDGNEDYFIRTDGSDISATYYSPQGSYFFAAQDLNKDGMTTPATLTIDDIDISGFINLELRIYIAEDDASDGKTDWDKEDYLHIDYDIDNSGTFSNGIWVENDGSTYNSSPFIDTDYDGIGDGTEITDTFTQFTQNISGSGSLLDIKVTFGNLDSGDEDIAIDHIEIWGTPSSTDQPDWCNLQWPETGNIRSGDSFTVYARVYEPGITDNNGQGNGIEAWIGISKENNDPTDTNNSTDWTWIPANYNMDYGNNDEYMADISSHISQTGKYYYVSRFRFNNGPYVYGGYSDDGNNPPTSEGGFWDNIYNEDGIGYHSGQLSVDEVDWCNLQSPENGNILSGENFEVYFQIYEEGITDQAGQGTSIQAWIGYSSVDNDPTDSANAPDWTWIPATYNTDNGNNDEYMANLGTSINNFGTYFYASRFQINNGPYAYGGYNGGFWQNIYSSGGNNKSGQLQILAPEISITGNGNEITNGDTSPDISDDTEFGLTETGTGVNHTFTINNLGNTNLYLSGSPIVSISGDTAFSIQTQPANSTISAANSETFTIRFAPTTSETVTATISIANDDNDENPYTFTIQGTGFYSEESDIITNGNEAVNISSLINDPTINSISEGVEVWQFTIRDGGADLIDADNQPTILTDLILTQAPGNAMNDWNDALQSVALFDGNTLISNTPSISSNQIQFSGLNISAPDNSQKTLSLRISLQTSPNDSGSNNDGDDFVFQISQGNVIANSTGSQFTNFSVQKSTNGQNVFEVIATELAFIQQPSDIGQGSVMFPYPEVAATDTNGNIDLDFSNDISISSTGTMTNDPISILAIDGISIFDNIVHTVAGTGIMLTATTNGLVSVTSNPFDVLQQTILKPGDLAILAVNTNIGANGEDQIAFVCFKDIIPGTQIFLTDNGYERQYANEWGGTEGLIKITRINTTLPKGTIIVYESNTGNVYDGEDYNIFTCGSVDNDWNKEGLSGQGIGGFNLNNNDDVWIMQGGTWNNDTNHHSTYNGRVLYGWTESGWDNLPPNGSDRGTAFSNLFENSNCFTTSAPSGDGKVKFDDPNDPDFSTNTNDQLDWIALINTSENWTGYSDNSSYNSGGFNYKDDSNCPQISISNSTHTAGKWTGTKNTNWFDCNNWDNLNVPDENTDVSIDNNASNEVIIDASATHSDLYNNIAKTKDLYIQENIWLEVKTSNDILEIHGDLIISNNGILDANDNDHSSFEDGQIYIYGNWINNYGENGFDQGNSTVIFMGSSPQTITQNNGTDNIEKFFNLKIDNPNGLNFSSGNIHAEGFLTLLQSPDLNIGNGHYILAGKGLINNGINISVENEANFIQTDEGANIIDNAPASYILNKTSQPLNHYYEYVYWSSPIQEGNLKMEDIVSNAWGYYEYDPADTSYPAYPGWISKNPTDLFQTGLGYAISAPNGTSGNIVLTPSFTKDDNPFNSGTISYTLRLSADNDPDGDNDYNLIGNPYPSALDFDKFAQDNANIEGAYYAWTNCAGLDANLHHQEQGYTIYSVGSGSTKACSGTGLEASRHIATAQGFMVEAIGNGQIQFKNTHRSLLNNNFINRPVQMDRFWLDLTNSDGAYNQILLAFSPNATNKYDRLFDAHYLDSGNGQEFYSLNQNEKWAIQGLPNFGKKEEYIIPIGLKQENTNQIKIHLNKTEGSLQSMYIYLHDKKTETMHLLNDEDFEIIMNSGEINDRFEIILRQTALYNEPVLLNTNEIIIDQNANQYEIQSLGNKEINQVKIILINGQEILNETNLSTKNKKLIINNLSKGNLVIFSILLDNKYIQNIKYIVK